MRKGNPTLWVFLVLLVLALLPGGCLPEAVKIRPIATAAPAKASEQSSVRESYFTAPAGAVYIELPENADHEDYAAFDRAFEEAVAAREAVICTAGAAFNKSWPELCVMDYGAFWVKSIRCSKQLAKIPSRSSATTVYTYRFEYFDLSEQEIQEMKWELDAQAGAILARIPEDADEWTTALILHDELVKTVTYDKEKASEYYFTTYGTLVRGEAVCQGYTAAYSFLLSRAGIYSSYSASEDHGWNSVPMPRTREQYVDCTWDDPDLCDAYGNPYVFHDFFFLTREEVEAVDSHTILTGDAYNSYDGKNAYANYFRHEGYMLSSYDEAAMTEAFRRQYLAGNNLLEVRFETKKAYERAISMVENDSGRLFRMLNAAGYYGAVCCFHRDELHTLSIGLDPA